MLAAARSPEQIWRDLRESLAAPRTRRGDGLLLARFGTPGAGLGGIQRSGPGPGDGEATVSGDQAEPLVRQLPPSRGGVMLGGGGRPPWRISFKPLKSAAEVDLFFQESRRPERVRTGDSPRTDARPVFLTGGPDVNPARVHARRFSKTLGKRGSPQTLVLAGVLYRARDASAVRTRGAGGEEDERWAGLSHRWLVERFGDGLLMASRRAERAAGTVVRFMVLTTGPRGEALASEVMGAKMYYSLVLSQYAGFMEAGRGSFTLPGNGGLPTGRSERAKDADRSAVAEYSRVVRWVEGGAIKPRWTSADFETQFYLRAPHSGRNLHPFALPDYYLGFGEDMEADGMTGSGEDAGAGEESRAGEVFPGSSPPATLSPEDTFSPEDILSTEDTLHPEDAATSEDAISERRGRLSALWRRSLGKAARALSVFHTENRQAKSELAKLTRSCAPFYEWGRPGVRRVGRQLYRGLSEIDLGRVLVFLFQAEPSPETRRRDEEGYAEPGFLEGAAWSDLIPAQLRLFKVGGRGGIFAGSGDRGGFFPKDGDRGGRGTIFSETEDRGGRGGYFSENGGGDPPGGGFVQQFTLPDGRTISVARERWSCGPDGAAGRGSLALVEYLLGGGPGVMSRALLLLDSVFGPLGSMAAGNFQAADAWARRWQAGVFNSPELLPPEDASLWPRGRARLTGMGLPGPAADFFHQSGLVYCNRLGYLVFPCLGSGHYLLVGGGKEKGVWWEPGSRSGPYCLSGMEITFNTANSVVHTGNNALPADNSVVHTGNQAKPAVNSVVHAGNNALPADNTVVLTDNPVEALLAKTDNFNLTVLTVNQHISRETLLDWLKNRPFVVRAADPVRR
ncbi:MAG: hypothetical protein LBP95_03430, partial [Deltaproteobacteria bacterium]|nr:hypothetical protein [Deltaproteobacteria bacterium]